MAETNRFGDWKGFLRGLAVAVVAGGFLALAGAFGSAGAPVVERFLYWIPLMILGGLWGHVCARAIGRWIDTDLKPWLAAAALTTVIAGPLTLAVWALTGLFFARSAPPLSVLPDFLGPVVVVTGVMSVLNIFLSRAQPVETHAAARDAPPSRFLDRMPPKLRGAALRAVESEDHYLRLHTDRGSDLILMRLSDALGELEGLEGAQTHRSWWVARDAVRGVSRGDGRAALTLEGGVVAPVSRRYARALRAAGWY